MPLSANLRRAAPVFALALCCWASPLLAQGPRLDSGVLSLHPEGLTAQVSLTAEGALRITALAKGAKPEPLPSSIELPKGAALQVAGSGFAGGAYALAVDAAGALQVSQGGKGLARVTFERDGDSLRARLEFDGAKVFHGFGQVAAALALTNEKLLLRHEPKYGDQTYLYLPFFFTDTGAAVSFNAAGRDRAVLEKGSAATLSTTSGKLDLYLWSEQEPATLVARQYKLAGARSLLPRWAYGYLQSKYGYRNEAEVRRVVSAFARFSLPLQGLVLDHYWFKRMGDLDWDAEAFPDPAGLAKWMDQQGVKLISITEPFFTKDSKSYWALDAAGGLSRDAQGKPVVFTDWWDFGKNQGGGVFDPESTAAQALLGERYAALARAGVAGFWIDLGEPERVPEAARFGAWSEAAYHNAFNLGWARIVRAAVEKATPGKRPFILSRSGYTGISGLGVSTWSGDVPATWEGLRDQLPLGLNASISGLPFWGSDVGGFVTSGGDLVPPDPELYLRWQQFGSFTPVYRAHGAGPREPWIYGAEWMARVKGSLDRRAFLLPYVYSTAYQVWSEGMPMMRPLFLKAPQSAALHSEDAEYLFGDSILISPVTQPLSRESEKRVVLPAGGWRDAFTGQRLQGPATVQVKLSLETFPLYYREGAILPAERAGKELLLLVPGPETTRFTVFSDDGETEAYRAGAGEKLQVTLSPDEVVFEGSTRARELVLLFPSDAVPKALAARAVRFDALWMKAPVTLSVGRTRVALR